MLLIRVIGIALCLENSGLSAKMIKYIYNLSKLSGKLWAKELDISYSIIPNMTETAIDQIGGKMKTNKKICIGHWTWYLVYVYQCITRVQLYLDHRYTLLIETIFDCQLPGPVWVRIFRN